ncbi:Vitamin K epoxide reductase family protein [Planctomycetes bacterium Pan216]|uniref:Vitamin K epoxide reductase family protein n=1 Tax=Kolteria novifilia TaxID=2527975 RepID=A0A518AXR3_9BACT|nr:Vitamin K epoxide reductase family protein [Planctomycetes bacterium Pan216]
MGVRANQGYPAENADWEVAVPPFSYNPAAWSQRIPICVLASIACVIAIHLSLYQWGLIDEVWDPFFGKQSEEVLKSNVAEMIHRWVGIPDAALGAFAYLGDAVYGLAGSTRRWQYRPWMVILFGIDVIPLGFVSALLVFCQATIVGQWCFLCIVTAIISLILVYMAFDEVYSSLKYLYLVWKKSRDTRMVWNALWSQPVPVMDEIERELLVGANA